VRANSQQLVRFSDDFRHLFIRNEVTTGTAEVNRLQQVTLFPNPAHDRLTLQGLTPHKDVVTVMNITGKRELSMVADETTFSVSLNGLAPGMYLIKIQSGDASIIKKIILQ
jgi:hypothetical protein